MIHQTTVNIFLKDGTITVEKEKAQKLSKFFQFFKGDTVDMKFFSERVVGPLFTDQALNPIDLDEAKIFAEFIGSDKMKERMDREIYVKNNTDFFNENGYISGKIKYSSFFDITKNEKLKNYLSMRVKFDRISDILNHPSRINDYVSDKMYFDTKYLAFLKEKNIEYESKNCSIQHMLNQLKREAVCQKLTIDLDKNSSVDILINKFEQLDSHLITSGELNNCFMPH